MSYKQPPIKNKFQRGVSGNPGGRPKGRKASPDPGEALYRVFARKMHITENNKRRKVYFAEVMILEIWQNSPPAEDSRAVFALVKLLDWFPVNNEELHHSEMNADAERATQKIQQMIEDRKKKEADDRDAMLASLFGRRRMHRFGAKTLISR